MDGGEVTLYGIKLRYVTGVDTIMPEDHNNLVDVLKKLISRIEECCGG